MKKFLPKSVNNPHGFTLIELLIVITILSVLAVIGFAVFNGLAGRGNDSKRQADVKAIADALEVKKSNNATYQTVTGSDFTGGVVPKEPATRTEKYCYSEGTSVIANPADWTGSACPNASWTSLDYSSGTGTVTVAATTTFFKVCTVDQAKTTVICFGSRQ